MLGTKWRVIVVTDREFDGKLQGKHALAFTFPDTRLVALRVSETGIRTVRHEVFHAYFCTLKFPQLPPHGGRDALLVAAEERGAEVVEAYLPDIQKLSKRVARWAQGVTRRHWNK